MMVRYSEKKETLFEGSEVFNSSSNYMDEQEDKKSEV